VKFLIWAQSEIPDDLQPQLSRMASVDLGSFWFFYEPSPR
jgi:hypothetical protein